MREVGWGGEGDDEPHQVCQRLRLFYKLADAGHKGLAVLKVGVKVHLQEGGGFETEGAMDGSERGMDERERETS
jgi:hypothetical protein